jgi:hypothetical protein
MGIKHFFRFFKDRFASGIFRLQKGETLAALKGDSEIVIDNLLIDMNGLFHNSAQKIYQYGNFKAPPRLLTRSRPASSAGAYQKQLKVFQDVCSSVDNILNIVKPRKRLIMCVDGPAPLSKQAQQRQRRFMSALEADENRTFDSCSITPGTKFMDFLSKYIDWYIRKQMSNPDCPWSEIEIIFSSQAACGEGEHKCFEKGTLILLWDGSVKKVEDIKSGDKLIGDDGTVRTVKDLVSGRDEMYEISQSNGGSYTVNKNHILSLKIADHRRIYWSVKQNVWVVGWLNRTTLKYQRKQFICSREIEPQISGKQARKPKTKEEARIEAEKFLETIPDDDVLDISVAEYLKLPENTKRKLYGYKCPGVEWVKQEVDIDPYLLGLWLGDGTAAQPEIATTDQPIVDFLEQYCEENEFRLSHNENCITYRICDDFFGRNRLTKNLKKYNVWKNKHIPREYLVNDRETRLQLLAGLIDTDGNVVHAGRMIRFSQGIVHKRLFEDVVYLARSLGFSCNVREFTATYTYKGEKREKEALNVTISGNIHEIPTKLAHKKCNPPPVPGHDGMRSIRVDKLKSSITVTPVGREKYYGFNTDGNRRFLLGDFTVTHNCMSYVRKYGLKSESFCINGMDADLIMLALASHMPKFYVLREEMVDPNFAFYVIDISTVRSSLGDIMRWEESKFEYDVERAINDFIFMCFFVGNDFLPHIPGIEIIEGGIEFMFDVYKTIGAEFGHITRNGSKGVQFHRKSLAAFLGTISQYEKGVLENKLAHKDRYFPNPLLENCATTGPKGEYELDIEAYRHAYYTTNLSEAKDEKTLCHEYLEGMQWVLSYYTQGATNWKWCFPHHYAPFAHTIAKHVKSFKFPEYEESSPTIPFIQLLSVLPPKSADLLPAPLDALLKGPEMKKYCPEEFPIDLSGCKNTWEATVILPMIKYDDIEKLYNKYIQRVPEHEQRRNVVGKSHVYQKRAAYNFHSFYGDFVCSVTTKNIDL